MGVTVQSNEVQSTLLWPTVYKAVVGFGRKDVIQTVFGGLLFIKQIPTNCYILY